MHLVRCGSGDPILFIHGMSTSSQLWSQIIALLCAHFDCFAIDLPGMGETPQIAYDAGFLRKIAEQIDQIRLASGIEKWHVVGHDAGSAVAVHYAKYFPQHVACMALLAPALFPELRPFYLLEILRTPVVGEVWHRLSGSHSGRSRCSGLLRRSIETPKSLEISISPLLASWVHGDS